MSINKENMNINQNRNRNKTWVIVKENKKLDYIEHIIKSNHNTNVREMETLISNFIDYTCEQKLLEAEKCRILIKEKQPENYDKIIYAANGLIYNYDLIIG
jgi:hypoxanthine phosphoribosyltransferase